MIRRGSAEQFGLAVGDLDGEIDAEIDQRAEAFEVGEERLDPGELGWPDIAGAAAHVVGVADFPIGAAGAARSLELLAEGARPHWTELREGEFGPSELFFPEVEFFVLHTDHMHGP